MYIWGSVCGRDLDKISVQDYQLKSLMGDLQADKSLSCVL